MGPHEQKVIIEDDETSHTSETIQSGESLITPREGKLPASYFFPISDKAWEKNCARSNADAGEGSDATEQVGEYNGGGLVVELWPELEVFGIHRGAEAREIIIAFVHRGGRVNGGPMEEELRRHAE